MEKNEYNALSMAVSIRLAKIGKKNAPSYRIVAAPKRSSRSGRVLEILGYYNPFQKGQQIYLNKERIKYWQDQGAAASEAVQAMLKGNYVFRKYNPGSNTKPTEK